MTGWEILEGDCVPAIAAMPDASIDAVVCDPPYGLSFMGKEWDTLSSRSVSGDRKGDAAIVHDVVAVGGSQDGAGGNAYSRSRVRIGAEASPVQMQRWHEAWAVECLRVLRPGGHLLAFGGTRTYHRLAAGIEDAGFEIRDTIAWMYGSGFPKSLDVSKAIDKVAGVEREVLGVSPNWRDSKRDRERFGSMEVRGENAGQVTAPATPDAQAWEGWGTALKPAYEPVVVARKPLSGTVAGNVLAHGTGALNINGCRIAFQSEADELESKDKNRHGDFDSAPRNDGTSGIYGADIRTGSKLGNYDPPGRWPANVVLDEAAANALDTQTGESTSRFLYCAKSSTAERSAGLPAGRNVHPTVKPIELMRWLVRLVTPPGGGLVLDPFAGSGTTGIAAVLEGFRFVGCEREPEYAAIARARIGWWAAHPEGVDVDQALAAEGARRKVADSGQGSLLDAEAAA